MKTLEQFFSGTEFVDSCWIAPYTTTYVDYEGKKTYLIKAIFDLYEKDYNGKIERFCRNNLCINPDHMWSPTEFERFWSNIRVGKLTDCWEWRTYSGTDEYAETTMNEKYIRSHAKAWEYFNERKVPEGMFVCHHCDNPPCCNPWHLFIGTHQDNVDDRERKGRNKIPRVKGINHGQSKLTPKEVLEIREKYLSGNYSYRTLSEMYGTTFGNVRKIVKRQTWRHI